MAISQVGNVIRSITDGDTVSGPCIIKSVKVNGGSATTTATLTVNSIEVYDSGQIGANVSALAEHICIKVPGGQSALINLTGAGAAITLYIE